MEITWLAPVLTNWVGWDLLVGFDSSSLWWFKFEKGDQSGRVCSISEDEAGVRDVWILMVQDEGGGSVAHVRGLLDARLNTLGQTDDLAAGFPFLAIAKTAIRGFDAQASELHRHYPEGKLTEWAHYGLAWIAELDVADVDQGLVKFLSPRMTDRSIPQAIRQRLRPFVTQWESKNGPAF